MEIPSTALQKPSAPKNGWRERAGTGLEHRYAQGLQKGEAHRFQKGETHSHHCPFPAPWRLSGAGQVQGGTQLLHGAGILGASRAMDTPGVTGMGGAGGNTSFVWVLIVIQEN